MNVINNTNKEVTAISSNQTIVDNKENTDTFENAIVKSKEIDKKSEPYYGLPPTPDITLAEYKRLIKKEDLSFEESSAIGKFMASPEGLSYSRSEQLKSGNDKDIETIVTIGKDKITVNYEGWITSPNKYGNYISDTGNFQETLNNLYQAFGKENVKKETFIKGEGPTNAEYFEETTGKNFYRYVMSDGRFG